MKQTMTTPTTILKAIFEETTNGRGENRRYIARSYPNGTGWGVYDCLTNKFLPPDLPGIDEANFREVLNEA